MRSVLGVYLVTDEASCAGRSLTAPELATLRAASLVAAGIQALKQLVPPGPRPVDVRSRGFPILTFDALEPK
jgi:hypothetical protein